MAIIDTASSIVDELNKVNHDSEHRDCDPGEALEDQEVGHPGLCRAHAHGVNTDTEHEQGERYGANTCKSYAF